MLEAALAAEHARADKLAADHERLLHAYQQVQLELKLLRRSIYVASAERVDTKQLEMEFAHKQAGKPAELTDRDVGGLIDTFGRERAVDLIWYGAWCNYMTRVADAFQLPLERENVFAAPAREKSVESKRR